MKAVREVVEASTLAGVEVLSLFAFSHENWQRPQTEVKALMSLLEEYVQREADQLDHQGVCVHVLGDLERLQPSVATAVDTLVARTAGNDRLLLNLFISYGARAELVRAAKLIARDVLAGQLHVDDIDEDSFGARLYAHDSPDPDLLIRTSGEQRISNFLLWQLAYTEIYISPVLWPDFNRRTFYEAILDFQRRERRFGRVTA